MRALSIAQRVMLLQQGLNDRSGKLDIIIDKTLVDFEVRFKRFRKECPKLGQVSLSFPQLVKVYLRVLYRIHFLGLKVLVLRSSTVCFNFSVFYVWRN